uniref:nickel insertion protein n=1 Tax=Anaerococcus mediterraneensis TaxID=1870984 RepID=UPI002F916DA0
MGFAMEKLMAVALDTYFTPIFMKKNRPAYKLSVIYKAEDEEKIEDIIFRETTSIGLRKFDLERTTLPRTMKKITYKNKDYYAKQVSFKDEVFTYPEYESAKKLAENEKMTLKDALDLIKTLARE